jgi:hypothetical protein
MQRLAAMYRRRSLRVGSPGSFRFRNLLPVPPSGWTHRFGGRMLGSDRVSWSPVTAGNGEFAPLPNA